jgi:MOSC domain-containing protein YiiM
MNTDEHRSEVGRAMLVQVRVGRVRKYAADPRSGEEWTSAIGKMPVSGPVVVSDMGIDGDQQADRINHGGLDKAILCYPREHYAKWAGALGSDAPETGTLGENFEIEGASEKDVCVGDVFQIGGVMVQISQPRQPCWKPAMLHGLPNLTALILKTGRTGWYLRVLQGGSLVAPQPLLLRERPHAEWNVARATRVMHFERDPAMRADLAGLTALSESWKSALRE